MELWLPMDTYELQHRYKYEALYHALRDAIHAGTLVGARGFLPHVSWQNNMRCHVVR